MTKNNNIKNPQNRRKAEKVREEQKGEREEGEGQGGGPDIRSLRLPKEVGFRMINQGR